MATVTEPKSPSMSPPLKRTHRDLAGATPDADATAAGPTIPAHRPPRSFAPKQGATTSPEKNVEKASEPKAALAGGTSFYDILQDVEEMVNTRSTHLDSVGILGNTMKWVRMGQMAARTLAPSLRLQELYNALEPRVRGLEPLRSHKLTLTLLALPSDSVVAAALDRDRLAALVAAAAAAAGPPRPGQDRDRFWDDFAAAEDLKVVLGRVFEGAAGVPPALAAQAVAAMVGGPKQDLLELVGTQEARDALVACLACRARCVPQGGANMQEILDLIAALDDEPVEDDNPGAVLEILDVAGKTGVVEDSETTLDLDNITSPTAAK